MRFSYYFHWYFRRHFTTISPFRPFFCEIFFVWCVGGVLRPTHLFLHADFLHALMVCPWKKKTFSFLRHTPLVHADFLHAKIVHAENLHALPYYCHGRKKNYNFRSLKIKITFLLRFLNRFKSYHENRIEVKVHADFLQCTNFDRFRRGNPLVYTISF